MRAKIVQRRWVLEWFDERMDFHMPSLALAPNGSLLCAWNGGFMQWNGDPMGRDANDWVSLLRPGADQWSPPDAVGCDIRYACHDPIFIKNSQGEITLLYAKFLDTAVNYSTWCNGRDELWMRKTRDGGETWLPARLSGIISGHASNDSALLPDGSIVFASTSSELPEKYFGAIRVHISNDGGETFAPGPLLSAGDGSLIREPALCLRPGGSLRMFTRTCPGNTGWGEAGGRSLPSYTCESRDGGWTWSPPQPSGILNNESKLDVVSWAGGTILMAYNDTPQTDWHERSPLSLACTADEGKTWENLLTLADAPGNKCQPAMCVDAEGRLNIVYMHRHTAIEHLVVEIE
ncbi:MAG: exo-alpha-sialidase [Clostridiales bacterium]|jgi:predicted neuraminidase|nr:exo-alpha-sialidase [Clostridiales bacterium]